MQDLKKLQYEAPTIRLIQLAPADIITNSGPNYDDMLENDKV